MDETPNNEDPRPQGCSSEDTHITIKIQRQREHDMHFRIKRTTSLRRLIKIYFDRLGIEYGDVRFYFEGTRVKDQSVDELEMEDGDSTDAFCYQTGGSA